MQLGGTGQRILITNAEEEAIEVTIPELIGDFSLNAANAITAYEYLQSGLSRITASYDLSGNAITELASLLGNNSTQLDVILHTHMPIFHTEHCVFARFLSKGNSYLDCGHVCTRNTVHLRDQNGNDNLALADMGCRNTVFSAESQTGVFSMNDWVRAGVGNLRIELVDESGIDATKIVNSYLQFLSKEIQASDVWDRLKVIPDSNGRLGGVGFGSLRNAVERRSGAVSKVH
jgi:putative protease